METIWKFPFQVNDFIEIDMPAGAEILAVQVQIDIPCLWALVTPGNPKMRRRFRLFGTGHKFDRDGQILRHVGTFQLKGGALVFHLFECM